SDIFNHLQTKAIGWGKDQGWAILSVANYPQNNSRPGYQGQVMIIAPYGNLPLFNAAGYVIEKYHVHQRFCSRFFI
ncbi:MAG: hypothetical protein OXN26_19835, partial [Gammaproteobacteria bacterium]|nr:hypothetical protein [Gammaproteobacteria bacterium]